MEKTRADEGTGRMEAQAGRGILYLLEQGRIAACEAVPGARDGELSREHGRYSTPLAGQAASPLQPLTPLAGTQELLDADNSYFH